MYTEELIQTRRYLHQHPEISFMEKKTAGYICRFLDGLGIGYRTVETSVVAHFDTGRPGKHTAFRADIDALPIQEQGDKAYCSTNDGTMHACGHDVHTAILMMAVKAIAENRDNYSGRFTFIFQQGEEQPPGGAVTLIKAGVLEGVDEIYGLHCDPGLEVGKIGSRVGPLMASVDRFEVTVTGKGGHGAMPHLCVDPIVVSSQIVIALQTVISRRTDPLDSALVTVGQIHSGNSFNVIPETAVMEGTVRTLSPELRQTIEKRVRKLCTGIAQANDCQADIKWWKGYPVLVNHSIGIEAVKHAADQMTHVQYIDMEVPKLLAEDFASYLEVVPGAFFFLGTRGGEASGHPLHSPYFDIDERVMSVGLELFLKLAL